MSRRFGSLTLTQRLFVLSAVALAPAFLIVFYNLVALRDAREKEVHAEARQAGQIAALEVERIVFGSEDVLKALATSPVVTGDGRACARYLAAVDSQLERFSTIRVLSADGRVHCSSEGPIEGSFDDRGYFREAVDTGRFVVGVYTEDRIDGRRVLPLALPTRNATGGIDRVVVGTLDLDWLGNLVRERNFSQGRALTIADRNGVIIAREPYPERFVGTSIPEAYRPLVTAPTPGTRELASQDGTERIIGYFPVAYPPRGLYISAGIGREEMFAPIRDASLRGLAMAGAGMVAALLFAFFTGRALVRRPVQRIIRTVEAWRRGEETARTGMTGDEAELGLVARAIDDYMDELVADRRLRRQAEQHRELLLRELDHRVKNILATVQAIARQTFRPGSDPEEQMAAYSARLSAIANAHALLVSDASQSADIGAVVAGAISPFRSEGDRRFRVSGPPLTMRSKSALALAMALHELCTNSVKYGALSVEEGWIGIDWTISGAAAAERLQLTWREHEGPPVEPPDRTGFGSRMIERLLAAEMRAEVTLDYPADGVVCRLDAPLAAVDGDGEEADTPSPAARQPSREPASAGTEAAP